MTAATAERFGQRPSDLLHLPPDEDWLRYCVDEALHTLAAGHRSRDDRWDSLHRDWHREDSGDGADGRPIDLYRKTLADPRTGRPPSPSDLAAIDYAAEYSGRASGAVNGG